MVVVSRAAFDMGAKPDESGTEPDERPRTRITFPADFALGAHEVTRAQFARFVESTGYDAGGDCQVHDPEGEGWVTKQGADWRNPGFDQTDDEPVVCVSWNDAQAYIAWLRRISGERYRLPSEAEWEYVARSGPTLVTRDVANYGAEECCGPATGGKDRFAHTAPVGSFGADAFGAYDVRGNVWEWLEDCYHESYRGAPADGRARTQDCSHPDRRSLRGGSWGDAASFLRPGYRLRGPVDGRYFTLGFRVARNLD